MTEEIFSQQSPLSNLLTLIEEDFGYQVHVASEIEFYFIGGEEAKDNEILAKILLRLKEEGIVVASMQIENGHRQYEIALAVVNNVEIVCEHTNQLKEIITTVANEYGVKTSFAAKPFENQPGSGLHIHLHLENARRYNVFQKLESDNDNESPILEHCVWGLLDTLLESMVYFAPHEEDYKRYTAQANEDVPEEAPLRRYNNAPVKVSWGSNNRTVAIRIPSSSHRPEERHLEHRVSSPDADIYGVMTAILGGIYHGLKQQMQPSEKIHGNAFDDQYERPLLPTSLSEAKKLADSGKVIKTYMQK